MFTGVVAPAAYLRETLNEVPATGFAGSIKSLDVVCVNIYNPKGTAVKLPAT